VPSFHPRILFLDAVSILKRQARISAATIALFKRAIHQKFGADAMADV
jgi:hypothetical protein